MNIATVWHSEIGEWSAWIQGDEEEGPYGSGRTEEEAKDNLGYELDMREQMRLERAAPALLEALENALNVLAALATGQLKGIKPDSPAIAQARTAIAKAKGGKR